MFALLGRCVSRAWPLVLVGWVGLLLLSRLAAPPWQEVAQDKEFAFLPQDAPSRRSEAVFQKAFPDDQSASNIVIVAHRRGNEDGHLDQDKKFIEDVLEPGLRQIAEAEGGLASDDTPADENLFGNDSAQPAQPRSIIARLRTPNAPGIGALLVSPDRKVLLVALELTTEFLSNQNWPTITRIEDLIGDLQREGKVPPGLELALTGSAVIGRDHTQAEIQSARATGLLTVTLVVGLLILIYRAPLLAIIPLATVYLAVEVSLGLLALLAGAGYLTLFQGIQIYVTIVAYGAGVDYCLFLTARYHEELDAGLTPAEAVARTITDLGATLTASACTVIGGIGMMMFAQFGKFREAGFAIPFTLCLVLAATLTFSPSLLRLAGRWAFWPQRRQKVPAVAGAALAAPTLGAKGIHRGWEKTGQLLLRAPGAVWLVAVGLMAPFAVAAGFLSNHLSYDLIGDLPATASSVEGTRILREHFPAGIIGTTEVLLVNRSVDFAGGPGRTLVRQLTDGLRERQQDLGLADVRSLTAPLGITEAAQHAFARSDRDDPERQKAVDQAALEHYVTDFGARAKIGARFVVVLQHSPFSHHSVADLDRVEQALRDSLPPELRQDTEFHVSGPTASVRDLQAVIKQDRSRIELLVLASVLLILLLLLREVVVPVYLLLSVFFSYYVTLGVSFLVFWLLDMQGFAGLDWKVAIFLFTILIAVGEDYNIFLMSRIHEEQRRHGPVRGIVEALLRTGPIISSCGIIMAGTLASLMAGSLFDMKQLGFALGFGILLDTFVVRPLLVPAFLILLAERGVGRGARGEGKAERVKG